MTATRFIDAALARRLEEADVSANVEYARAHARLYPEARATWLRVAGGYAVFAGADSPLTQAVGLALDAPAGEAELEEMEDFFRLRGANVAVEVCPLADASLVKLLGARGYRVEEFTNKLFLPLGAGGAWGEWRDDVFAEGDARVRSVKPEEGEAWARALAAGFADEGAGGDGAAPSSDATEPPFLDIFHTSLAMRTGRCFLAEVGGKIAGGGFLKIDGGVAALSTASVLPAARRRGVQAALIRARLAYGAERGCDLATVTARLDSGSHRNLERQGFRVAYTRPKMFREWTA